MSGSIRKRGKRSWQIQVELGLDQLTGERQRQFFSIKGTRRDAERALTEALHLRDTGIDVMPQSITVAEYLDRWLRDYAGPNVSASTFDRYGQIARRLGPLLGSIKLQGLRPAHVQAAYASLVADGLSPRTVLHHHRVLKQALSHAVRWQLLIRNPADAAQPPRPVKIEMRTLTEKEVETVLRECTDDEFRRLVYFAVATGLRLGELLGLRWRDVDQDRGQMIVQRSLQYLPRRGLVFNTPKTSAGRRNVALSKDTLAVLRRQRLEQAERRLGWGNLWHDEDLVFARDDGAPAPPYSISAAFRQTVRRLGLDGVRFHDLRHTAATLMLQQGIHPKVVSERLGHSSVSITLDTYSHVLPDMQRSAADALDSILPSPLRLA